MPMTITWDLQNRPLGNRAVQRNVTLQSHLSVDCQYFGAKKNGTFIECGAFDGETYANTLAIERSLSIHLPILISQGISFLLQ